MYILNTLSLVTPMLVTCVPKTNQLYCSNLNFVSADVACGTVFLCLPTLNSINMFKQDQVITKSKPLFELNKRHSITCVDFYKLWLYYFLDIV